MKKSYLLILSLFVKVGFAQDLAAPHASLDYVGPDTVSHAANVDIQNLTSDSLTVVVNRVSQTMTPGHETYFCWFECYDPSTSLSPLPIVLQSQESTPRFEGWVNPHSIPGDDVVTYNYYDMYGHSDTLTLTFTYHFGPTGISETSVSKYHLSVFVNDDHTASVNYVCNSLTNSKIQICNVLGRVVKESMISNKIATVKINLDDLPSGVYFCGLLTDGKYVAAKKFFVSQ